MAPLANDNLVDRRVAALLAREHEQAGRDAEKLAGARARIDRAKADGSFSYDLYPDDVYLAIEPAMGRFLYLAARAIGARHIVEFGTSFGISTVYLAAAAQLTRGSVIGSELVEAKAQKARANLAEAGLSKLAQIRAGDALQTLKALEDQVDFLFLDGWKDCYVPVLDLLTPALRPGAIVAADNIATFPDELQRYLDRVSKPDGRFQTVVVPFESGLALSVYRGDDGAETCFEQGTITGIARKAKKRAHVETLEAVSVTRESGLQGDSRGRFRDRAVTVVAEESWRDAVMAAGLPADAGWTLRRANLLTRGVQLPRAPGGVIRVGDVLLETTGETRPCNRMDEQHPGLRKALSPDWRGGVTCRVLKPGFIRVNDPVQVLVRPEARERAALPG